MMKKRWLMLSLVLCCAVLLVGCSSTCKTEGCQNEPVEKSKYCAEHVCLEAGCFNGKVGASYCEEHFACAAEGCTAERLLDGQYCAEHDRYAKMQEFGEALGGLINAWS
ncbi:MAG: hypothetical protein IKM15_05655 [Peptococcaceae bacterium]|nr:hypothetical protein [Peptococcaceae bacterium]